MFARLRKMTVSPLMSALQDILAVTLFLNALECRYAAHILKPCHRLKWEWFSSFFLWDNVVPGIPFWLVKPCCFCFCFRPTIILWQGLPVWSLAEMLSRQRERECVCVLKCSDIGEYAACTNVLDRSKRENIINIKRLSHTGPGAFAKGLECPSAWSREVWLGRPALTMLFGALPLWWLHSTQ